MTRNSPTVLDRRALILTPAGRDSSIASRLISEAGLTSSVCNDASVLVAALVEGAGLAVIAEEAIATSDVRGIRQWIGDQPAWSDFPFVVLTRRNSEGAGLERNPAALRLMDLLGNVTFIERPFHSTILISALQGSLRARLRQYEVRDFLNERLAAAMRLRRSEDSLRLSEERYRLLVDAMTSVVWVANPEGEFFTPQRSWQAYTGQDWKAQRGQGHWNAVHADDRAMMQADWTTSLEQGGSYQSHGRVWHEASRTWRWGVMRAVPLYTEDGVLREWIGTILDVHEQRMAEDALREENAERSRAEARLKLLLGELNHRVKNTLATVQSIATQTLRSVETPGEFRRAFEDRLIALSQTQNLLTRESWESAPLRDLIEKELEPYRSGDGQDQYELSGPHVPLSPKAAVALGMTLHELATNAAKYGAFSVPTGRLHVGWHIVNQGAAEPTLHLVWRESGGPHVEPPRRRGFGSRLVERSIRAELDGKARLDFRPSGLVFEMTIPLTDFAMLSVMHTEMPASIDANG